MVSVIIPIYNVEKYVDNCIESVLHQTHTDMEILLIDDGSIDNSGKVCDAYMEKDNRIKVVHKKNGGLSDARNSGIDLAIGEYIMFLDGDDYIHPQMVEILYKNLIQMDADMSACAYKKVEENQLDYGESIDISNQEIDVFDRNGAIQNYYRVNVTAWAKLYKRFLFDKLRYPVGKFHEDEYLIHQLIYYSKRIVCTNAQLYYYVQRKGSITACINWEKVEHALEALDNRILFVKQMKWNEAYDSVVETYMGILRSISERETNNWSKQQIYQLRKKARLILKENRDAKIPCEYYLWANNRFIYKGYVALREWVRKHIKRVFFFSNMISLVISILQIR